METLILLIGLYLGSPEPDIKILDKFANPKECNMRVEGLNQKAKTEQAPYRFFCRPVSGTVI